MWSFRALPSKYHTLVAFEAQPNGGSRFDSNEVQSPKATACATVRHLRD